MRLRVAASLFALSLAPSLAAQTCTGLCLQQVTCSSGQTTTITGTVYAPNGTDPLPNVTVYIPNAAVEAFTAGVSCPVAGTPPSGSPLVGTTTAVDGTFTLTNVPVGSNIPLVIVAGRWRRQLVVPSTAACANTSFSANMPKNQTEGDIPKFAIATGRADAVECVLRKVGIDASEFTNPSGTGRINFYSGSYSAGARIDSSTPSEDTLMSNTAALNQYDVLMLPCEGGQFIRSSTQLANFIQYANAGGRIYSSHFGYVWMYQNAPFNGVANWQAQQSTQATDGTATIDTTFTDGSTLAQWLQLVGASTTQGQIGVTQVKHDTNGVIAPTQSWLTLNDSTHGNPVQQFTFNTPIGAANQCGRVLFNEYHVEAPIGSNPQSNLAFPNECTSGIMTAQEKLLEFSLFNLSNDGGAATMTPATLDFGNVPVGFSSGTQTFTWKNNSIFAVTVSSATATGDFAVTSAACGSVAAGGTCGIGVAFKPTILGPRTGTLTVASNSNTLTASLTGTGVVALTASTSSLSFGNVDVGATSAPQTVTLTNTAPGTVTLPTFALTGDYALSSTCGATLAASSSCALIVTFKPTTTGTRTGTLSIASASPSSVQLTGNGVDFSFTLDPTSSSIIAGRSAQTSATTTPIAGFANSIALSCTTTAPGSTCTPSVLTFIPTAAVSSTVTITTTSEYTVIGYSGFGGTALLSLVAAAGGLLLYRRRKQAGVSDWVRLTALLLAAAGIASLSGCSGKYPSKNVTYTTPGAYTYTLTATDGTITHSATYTLTVTAK
jgi:hypothetical protein